MNESSPAPLTFDELLDRCMGELEFAQKILKDFFNSSEPVFDEIKTSLGQNRIDDASRQVHRLKGTAATLAARPLFDSLVALEALLKAGEHPSPSGMEQLHEKLEDSRNRFHEVREYASQQLFKS